MMIVPQHHTQPRSSHEDAAPDPCGSLPDLTCGAGGIADDHRRATEAALEHRAETAQPWPADIQVTSWLPISQADLHPRPSEGNQ
jgi:hypothetical protein